MRAGPSTPNDKSLTVRTGPIVGPQRPPVEPPPDVIKKPVDEPKPGSGKGNPYLNTGPTKSNPYNK